MNFNTNSKTHLGSLWRRNRKLQCTSLNSKSQTMSWLVKSTRVCGIILPARYFLYNFNTLSIKSGSAIEKLQANIQKNLKIFYFWCRFCKGGFFSDIAIRFSNLQISKKNYNSWIFSFGDLKNTSRFLKRSHLYKRPRIFRPCDGPVIAVWPIPRNSAQFNPHFQPSKRYICHQKIKSDLL
jgi:hypothetical protein